MANDNRVVGHEHFLDQQANDALALGDVEGLGAGEQTYEESGQRLGQSEGGGALGRLLGEGSQLRS